jgi:hypothetical protein
MKSTAVLRKNPDMVTRVIENETILLPIYKSSDEINCIYTLNKVASEVWNLINGKRNPQQIKKLILERFDATPEEVDKEMAQFLKDLKDIKAIDF